MSKLLVTLKLLVTWRISARHQHFNTFGSVFDAETVGNVALERHRISRSALYVARAI